MKCLTALLVGALLLPALALPTWAADGDVRTGTSTSRGAIRLITSVKLCDTKTSSDSTCTTWDFANSPGIPDMLVLERESKTDCAGNATATFTTSATSGGTAHAIGSSAVVVDDNTTRVVIDLHQAPLDRFLVTALTTMTSCTNLTVLMHFYEIQGD